MLKPQTWLAAVTMLATVVAGSPAVAVVPQDTVGVVDQTTGIWYLRGPAGDTTSFYYGNPGDYPMVGDWDCDTIDTPGLYRQSDGYVYLRNSNTQGIADTRFFFGNPGDIPLPGDFNADGCDTVSIYRPSEARMYVINKLGSNDGGLGAADYAFYFGNPGDKPFTGDFNGNGQDTVGLHRESTGFVYYRDSLTTGIADGDFFYGDPGDQLLAGRWAQDPMPASDTVGLFRPSNGRFYLRFDNSQGNANVDFSYGNSNMASVAGSFGALPGGDLPPPGMTAVPFDAYQSGYVFSFIATQAGVYGFGRIENPESPEDFQYNEGFDAASADVMERNAPSTEVTDSEWIAGYLRGNPTGWADGRGCTRPGPYPVPAGMGEIETDGWFAGYNAGFDSACNVGTTPPAWVGKSVCPYDPWKVPVIDQDVLCPPVRP